MEKVKVLNASFTLTGQTDLQELQVPETRGQAWSKKDTLSGGSGQGTLKLSGCTQTHGIWQGTPKSAEEAG